MGVVYFTREIIQYLAALLDIAFDLKRMNDLKEIELKSYGILDNEE